MAKSKSVETAVVVETPVAVVAPVATPRRASVSGEIFTRAYATGLKAGLSNKAMAEGIGMTEATFNVRLSQLRKKAKLAKEANPAFVNPFDGIAKRKRSTTDTLGMLSNVMAELDAVPAAPANDAAGTVEVGGTVSA